jgi:hypothetical protein
MTTNRASRSALLALLALAALAGCRNPASYREYGAAAGQPGAAANQSSLRLTFGAPSGAVQRTIVPGIAAQVSRVTVRLTDGSGASLPERSGSGPSGYIEFVGIAAGTWTVDASAYDSEGTLIASGTATAAIAAHSSVTVPLNLVFSASGAVSTQGDLDISLSWTLEGVDYLSWTLDGAAMAPPAVIVDGETKTARLAAEGLDAGVGHPLIATFMKGGSHGKVAGYLVEVVDVARGLPSDSWIDGAGTLRASPMVLDSSFFFDAGANLAGLSFAGASPSPSFDAAITSYALTGFSTTSFSFSATCVSSAQEIAYSWNGDVRSWASASGLTFNSSNLGLEAGTNTLIVRVRAPDRQTTKDYIFSVSCRSVSYDANGASGNVSATALVFENSSITVAGAGDLALTGCSFAGWNTASDSSGTTYAANSSCAVTSNTTLYARWTPAEPSFVIGSQSGNARPVTASSAAPAATIYYTTDGSTPTTSSPSYPGGGWNVSGYGVSATITAAAIYRGVSSSVSSSGAVSISWPGAPLVTGNSSTLSVSTFASTGSYPYGIATDGTDIYLGHYSGNVRKIGIGDHAMTVVSPQSGLLGLATDGISIFASNFNNGSVNKIAISSGAATTLATGFSSPRGLVTDGTYVYVCDWGHFVIKRITIANGSVMVLAGSGTQGSVNGNGTAASFNYPVGIALHDGFLYVTDERNIRKVSVTSPYAVTNLATGLSSYPNHICTDGNNLYFCMNYAIYQMPVSGGAATLLAGIPGAIGSQNGIAASATFGEPQCIAVCPTGSLFVADYGNNMIREIK